MKWEPLQQKIGHFVLFFVKQNNGCTFNVYSTYQELFAKADEALYEAKKKGGGQSVIYDEKDNVKVIEGRRC